VRTTPNKSETNPAPSTPPDIASASVSDTLAALHANPETGLTNAEVDTRRKERGYNEVAEKKGARSSCFSASSGACRRGCSNGSWSGSWPSWSNMAS
jgi:magnesium-transporting ATPase (P-type)